MYYYVQKGIFIMKNNKTLIFLGFILLYAIGVLIGSLRQVKVENQGEMYEYLEGAVGGYNVSLQDSIKSIFKDNLKLFVLLLIGGFFVIGTPILAVVAAGRGYSAGFAVTTVLRYYGIRGLLFCISNFISAAVIVPLISWYAVISVVNLKKHRFDRREFIKRFLTQMAIILPILALDSLARGFLSFFFIKIASGG